MQPELVEVRIRDLPGYARWSEKYADQHAALIAHLDSARILLRPDEIATVTDDLFDDLLNDLIKEFDS